MHTFHDKNEKLCRIKQSILLSDLCKEALVPNYKAINKIKTIYKGDWKVGEIL